MKCSIRHGGLWLLMFFCWLPAAFGQTGLENKPISQILITNVGPAAASEPLVRANLSVQVGDMYNRAAVDKDVINLYATGFFNNIRIGTSQDEHGVVLTYILQGKLRLTGIAFEGNTKFSNAKLLKKVTSKPGDPINEMKLFTDEQELETLYEKSGYTGTKVIYRITNPDEHTGTAGVTFEVTEAPKIRIVAVEFTGAHAFSQKKLRKVIKTRRHWMFSWLTRSGVFKQEQFEDDQDKLGDFYRNEGYIDFEITKINITHPTPTRMNIEFVIYEGTQYKVGAVTFKGNKLFTTGQIVTGLKDLHAFNRSKLKIGVHGLEADSGMILKPDSLDHDIHAVEDFYGARGYIDVRRGNTLNVRRIPNTETGTMDLEYNIEEGQKSFIEKIEIRGNVKTKDKVIRRELSVSPGDVFDMVQVRLSKQRVEGLDYFEKVDTKDEVDPTLEPTHKNLIVGVDEKSTGQFNFGAGFSTVESISGFVEVLQNNFDLFNPPYFTGGGQKFLLHMQVGTLIQDYRASFVEPWFLDRHLRLDVDLYRSVFNFQSSANLYDEARTGMRYTLTRALFGRETFLGSVSYNLEDVNILNLSTNAPTTIINDAGSVLVSRFGTSVAFDTRNGVELPNKGQRTSLSSLLTVGDRQYVDTEFQTAWYFKGLGEGDVLEVVGKAGVVQTLDSKDVPFYDRLYLGGQNDLRGFDYRAVGPRAVTQDGISYEPVGGDTRWFGSVEYSIPIVDHVRFALFYDIGNVSASPWSNKSSDVLGQSFITPNPGPIQVGNGTPFVGNTGGFSDNYGLGIHINIPHLGPLRLDYGIPIHHDHFSGSNGKLQFGVGFSRPL
jgi:outer membrane protein insertion porin family